jgi:hypothetical protein
MKQNDVNSTIQTRMRAARSDFTRRKIEPSDLKTIEDHKAQNHLKGQRETTRATRRIGCSTSFLATFKILPKPTGSTQTGIHLLEFQRCLETRNADLTVSLEKFDLPTVRATFINNGVRSGAASRNVAGSAISGSPRVWCWYRFLRYFRTRPQRVHTARRQCIHRCWSRR